MYPFKHFQKIKEMTETSKLFRKHRIRKNKKNSKKVLKNFNVSV